MRTRSRSDHEFSGKRPAAPESGRASDARSSGCHANTWLFTLGVDLRNPKYRRMSRRRFIRPHEIYRPHTIAYRRLGFILRIRFSSRCIRAEQMDARRATPLSQVQTLEANIMAHPLPSRSWSARGRESDEITFPASRRV
jgi:hypothetical protein